MKIDDITLLNTSQNLSTELPLYLDLLTAYEPSTKDTLEAAIWEKARLSKNPPDLAKLTHDIVMYKLEQAIISSALIKYQSYYNEHRIGFTDIDWDADDTDDGLEAILRDEVGCFSQEKNLGIFIFFKRVYNLEDIELQISKIIKSVTGGLRPTPIQSEDTDIDTQKPY